MARYLSRSQAFKKSVIKPTTQLLSTSSGTVETQVGQSLIAMFTQGGATNAEIELALERFQFKGLSERENPARRISIYDTNEEARSQGWTEEFKAQVEKVLDAGQGDVYFRVEAAPVSIPWPAYEEAEPEEIAKTARLVGVDLEHVLAYERANANRPEVIEALSPAEVEISA